MKWQQVVILVLVLLVSTVVLIVGIIKYKKPKSCSEEKDQQKLFNFLKKVKTTYFDHFRSQIAYDPSTKTEDFINKFSPYDPTPSVIKLRTLIAKKLRIDFNELLKELDTTRLKPREKKSIAQVRHYLDSTFGNPHGENYYSGDWMMGPNYYCINMICNLGIDLGDTFNFKGGFKPTTLEHVEKIIEILKKYKSVLERYTENMMYGVKAGMVRSNKDCQSARSAFQSYFPNIHIDGGKGVLKETFSQSFISPIYYHLLSENMRKKFEKKYKSSIEHEMSKILIEYVGNPIENFINFMENNYTRYCVPAKVASGLANLPLKYIWLDQNQTKMRTTPVLPTGVKLSGKKTYDMIFPFYTTTTKYSAKDIQEIGEKQLSFLYKKAVKIAMKLTGQEQDKAVSQFKMYLDSNEHYFNTTAIPDNENGELGGRRCKDMESAKLNCPVRYQAIQKWFQFAEMALALIEPKTYDMFYMTGQKTTTPNCPIVMRANFNPSVGSQSYDQAGAYCLRPSYYNMPFFLKRPGPRYNAFSVAGHEGRPGHHTQVQGFVEHFQSSGKDDVVDWLNGVSYYTAFTEGWALYGENPLLAQETDIYASDPLQEYGMLKWQLWRALRLIIDTGLHSRNMTMQNSLDMFEKYCWDTTDKAYKDSIRYMSVPGQATAYMIGQLEIWRMRNKTEEKLKAANVEFDKKEFHYQVLAQGSSPIDYLREHIDCYIACKINRLSRSDCQEILNPSVESVNRKSSQSIGSESRWLYVKKNYPRRQHFE